MSHMKTKKSLLIIYFIYILFGATIITKIEQPVEEERCRKGLYQLQIQIRDLQQEEAFLMWSVNFRRWNKVFSKRNCKTKDGRFRKIIFFRIRIESQARVYASFLLYVGDQRWSDVGYAPAPGLASWFPFPSISTYEIVMLATKTVNNNLSPTSM